MIIKKIVQEELRKVLQEFKRLIQAYGYDFLEKIGKPATDAIPTKEANRYLYLHHHELWKEYEVKMNTEKKEVEQVIDMIYQKLEELLDEPFKQVEDVLLGLAALYGHTICWGERGEWIWNEQEELCYIENILETKEHINPLNLIVAVWDDMRKYGKDKMLKRKY